MITKYKEEACIECNVSNIDKITLLLYKFFLGFDDSEYFRDYIRLLFFLNNKIKNEKRVYLFPIVSNEAKIFNDSRKLSKEYDYYYMEHWFLHIFNEYLFSPISKEIFFGAFEKR